MGTLIQFPVERTKAAQDATKAVNQALTAGLDIERVYVNVTDTAKLIRAALKSAFPRIKFGVRSSRFSGGSAIDISWTDGPNTAQVEAVCAPFSGRGATDNTDYTGYLVRLVDGKHVTYAGYRSFNRSWSKEVMQEVASDVISIHSSAPAILQVEGGQPYFAPLHPLYNEARSFLNDVVVDDCGQKVGYVTRNNVPKNAAADNIVRTY